MFLRVKERRGKKLCPSLFTASIHLPMEKRFALFLGPTFSTLGSEQDINASIYGAGTKVLGNMIPR